MATSHLASALDTANSTVAAIMNRMPRGTLSLRFAAALPAFGCSGAFESAPDVRSSHCGVVKVSAEGLGWVMSGRGVDHAADEVTAEQHRDHVGGAGRDRHDLAVQRVDLGGIFAARRL